MKRLSPAALLVPVLLAGSLTGCMLNLPNIREEKKEVSDEQLLDLYTTTATYLYDDESFVRAQDQAVKALEIDPENRAMRRMVGWIRLRMGSTDDLTIAEEFFRDLHSHGDENPATVLGLATTLERLGTGYQSAARRIEAGEIEPYDGAPRADAIEALTAKAKANWLEAMHLYESTLTEGEGTTNAINGLQRVCAMLGLYEDCLQWSERLLERSSEEIDVWRRLLTRSAISEKEENLFRENEQIARRLQKETHLFASTILNGLGRTEEAIAHLDAVVDSEPDLPQAYSLRAQLLAENGAYDRAIEDLDRFLGLSNAPFEDPEIRRAFDLRTDWERALLEKN